MASRWIRKFSYDLLTYSSLYLTVVAACEFGVEGWARSPEISCQSHLAPHARHLLQHHRFHQTCGISATLTNSLNASTHLRRMIVITQSKQSQSLPSKCRHIATEEVVALEANLITRITA